MRGEGVINYQKYQKIIELTGIKYIAIMLVVFYAGSLLPHIYYHWFLDLLSHFKLQYMLAGAVLGLVFLSTRKLVLAVLCFVVAISALAESRLILEKPLQFSTQSVQNTELYTIALYNHHYTNRNFDAFEAWLEDKKSPDLVILQEATQATSQFADSLKNIYPYQIHKPRKLAFGMVILSKHPFEKYEQVFIDGPVIQNYYIKISIKHPVTQSAMTIYALHTLPPLGGNYAAQRNHELTVTADEIAKDKTLSKILVGDLNVTPFSPVFKEVKDRSGLNYQSFGVLLNPTWPSRNFFLPLLQIPIDHVLHSDAIELLSKEVGPSFGSDHHMLITTLRLK